MYTNHFHKVSVHIWPVFLLRNFTRCGGWCKICQKHKINAHVLLLVNLCHHSGENFKENKSKVN